MAPATDQKADVSAPSPGPSPRRLSFGDVELDRVTVRVRRRGRDVALGPKEYRLIEFLLGAPGRIFTRAEIRDALWGTGAAVDERTVDVHILRLRKALSQPGQPDPIRTVRGVGYGLDDALARRRPKGPPPS